MKDIHTYGKEMARNGRTKDIYKGTFVCIQTLGLPPGVGLECFQSSQDAVKRHLVFLVLGKYNFGLELSCSVIRALSKEIVWLGCSYERARFILKLPFRKIPMPRSKSLN